MEHLKADQSIFSDVHVMKDFGEHNEWDTQIVRENEFSVDNCMTLCLVVNLFEDYCNILCNMTQYINVISWTFCLCSTL